MENYFFEIPIYRCTEEVFMTEIYQLKSKIENELEYERKYYSTEKFNSLVNNLLAIQVYPYQYNEAVGWIKLYVLGNQLRGELFFEGSTEYPFNSKTRINKGIRKKRFKHVGKAFEISISQTMSSDEILEKLKFTLERINKNESPFIKRYIDTTYLDRIGPFMDWKNLILQLNPYIKS